MTSRHATDAREWVIVLAISIALFVSVPVSRGGIGLGWDSMNHHIYLGWVASQPRFDLDFFAAASQSYQFPYTYWPIYKMAEMGWPGWLVGCVWALLHATAVLPLWLMAKSLIRGDALSAMMFRGMAALFGVLNILVLKSVESTGNDVLVALPYLWALALAVSHLGHEHSHRNLNRHSLLVGGLGGASVALKLSNGVLVPLLPLVCLCFAGTLDRRIQFALACCAGILLGWLVLYGPWGWTLWQEFGNPVFPFYDSAFDHLRELFHWREGGRS